MKVTSALFICFISLSLFSQKDSSNSALKNHKHSIGIDISPLVISLLGGYQYHIQSGLLHQFQLNEKYSLRNSINFSNENNAYSIFSRPEFLYMKDDTNYYSRAHWSSRSFSIRSGVQYNFCKKKFKPFVGLELIAGYELNFLDRYSYAYPLIYNGNEYIEDFESGPTNFQFENSKSHLINIGASLISGFNWYFRPRLSFGTQFNFDFFVGYLFKQELDTWNESGIEHITQKTSMTSFNFATTPFRLFFNFRF